MSLAEGYFVKKCVYISQYFDIVKIHTYTRTSFFFLVLCVLLAGSNSLLILSFSKETTWKQSFIVLMQHCLFGIWALLCVVKDINNAYPLTSSREAHYCSITCLSTVCVPGGIRKFTHLPPAIRSWLNHITPSQRIFPLQHSDVAQRKPCNITIHSHAWAGFYHIIVEITEGKRQGLLVSLQIFFPLLFFESADDSTPQSLAGFLRPKPSLLCGHSKMDNSALSDVF